MIPIPKEIYFRFSNHAAYYIIRYGGIFLTGALAFFLGKAILLVLGDPGIEELALFLLGRASRIVLFTIILIMTAVIIYRVPFIAAEQLCDKTGIAHFYEAYATLYFQSKKATLYYADISDIQYSMAYRFREKGCLYKIKIINKYDYLTIQIPNRELLECRRANTDPLLEKVFLEFRSRATIAVA